MSEYDLKKIWKWVLILLIGTPLYVIFFYFQNRYVYMSSDFPWVKNISSGLIWFSFAGIFALPFKFILYRTSTEYLMISGVMRRRKLTWNSLMYKKIRGPEFFRIIEIGTSTRGRIFLPLIINDNESFIQDFEMYSKVNAQKE